MSKKYVQAAYGAPSEVRGPSSADRVSEVWKTHDDNLKPRQLSDFSLARTEAVIEEVVLPLLDPELLLARMR